uniref:Asparagine synthetase domain-containing protein n=1 Tax=Acrobeloides nanus TaxID=290746 RepID=A0A914E5E7_9BILA
MSDLKKNQPLGEIFANGIDEKQLRLVADKIFENPTIENVSALKKFTGGWCFWYYRQDLGRVLYGQDIFGRKSLCWKVKDNKETRLLSFTISSFPGEQNEGWCEVRQGSVFLMDFGSSEFGIEINQNPYIQDERIPLWDLRIFNIDPLQMMFHRYSYDEIYKSPDDEENCTFKFYVYNQSHVLDAGIMLKPSTERLNKEEVDLRLNPVAQEFILRLKEALYKYIPQNEPKTPIPILFSGGVDSLMLSILANEVAHPDTQIILISVAFGQTESDYAEAPDRPRCIEAFKFLKQRTAPRNDRYRLVHVNVTREELAQCRNAIISKAIAPLNSVLDDSIGCVVWFGSRAKGQEYNPAPDVKLLDYENSPFALVGSGADELLGGYSRHRARFIEKGFEGLYEEIVLELIRSGNRNWNRDYRVGISTGKNLLAPYLDDAFVEWLNSLPLELKMDFSLPRGQGEKRILRVALKHLGVPDMLAFAPKRAMQFGSRMAKLENRKEKGSDPCIRILSN